MVTSLLSPVKASNTGPAVSPRFFPALRTLPFVLPNGALSGVEVSPRTLLMRWEKLGKICPQSPSPPRYDLCRAVLAHAARISANNSMNLIARQCPVLTLQGTKILQLRVSCTCCRAGLNLEEGSATLTEGKYLNFSDTLKWRIPCLHCRLG